MPHCFVGFVLPRALSGVPALPAGGGRRAQYSGLSYSHGLARASSCKQVVQRLAPPAPKPEPVMQTPQPPIHHPLPAGDPPPDLLPVDPDQGPDRPVDPQDVPPAPVVDPGR